VAGVKVGYKTLISGEGKLVVGKDPVRTGVTAILPRGKGGRQGCSRAFFPAMATLVALPFLTAGA
jgi:L-aminopeptidase/D-esterase-like protein